ncbi:MAG: hypothetical protein M3008_10465 [Chloroflexota bacterium]|nr:hypothetical protein [Chloroflexota bacterium]
MPLMTGSLIPGRLVTLPILLAREESAFDALASLADAHALVSDAERALAKERFDVLERRYQKVPGGFSDREHRELVTLATTL